MYSNATQRKSFRFRSAVFGLSAAGLFFACLPIFARQSERAGGEERSRFMERIDQAEGAERMADFRRQRLDGDYCFKFELEHLPRRGAAVRYQGRMWGSWNGLGPVSRFELHPEPGQVDVGLSEAVHLIIQNGAEPRAWIRKGAQQVFKMIVGDDVFEPVLPGVVYSPFDLQMPFIYWQEFEYEGPERVKSRIAQNFRMLPPVGSAAESKGVSAVRIALDDTYDALLQIEVLDVRGEALSRFTVESFKKVQEQYVVKEVTLKDYSTKARTRFRVKAASVGLVLNPALFDSRVDAQLPVIPESMFDEL
jgi:hypothetical protein